MGFGGVK